MAMLDLQQVNLRSLAEALEDHAPETSWWFDPKSGDAEPRVDPAYADHGNRKAPSTRT
jgi:hypothetical protein